MRSIVISPHCDDAILSLGGRLINKTLIPEIIINVFTKSNWTVRGKGKVDKITALRIEEDRKAFSSLGINTQYLGLMDATLRERHRAKNNRYLDPSINPRSDSIWIELVNFFRDLTKQHREVKNWFFPLAVGNHIDHRLLRDIAIKSGLLAQKNVYFYEDVGYDDTESDEKIQRVIKKLPFKLMPETYKYRNIGRKLDLLKNYASQVNKKLLAQVKRTYKNRSGERVWYKLGEGK